MQNASRDSLGVRRPLEVEGLRYETFSLAAAARAGLPGIERLPVSLKVLLENLLRHEDGRFVKAADCEALAAWDLKSAAQKEISFAPARVLLQDFTGVPAIVDLRRCVMGLPGLAVIPAR